MKKPKNGIFLALILSLVFLSGCAFPQGNLLQGKTEQPEATPQIPPELVKYEANLVDQFDGDLRNLGTASRYQIDLQIGDTPSNVSGHLEVLYTNTESNVLNEIYFRLFPNVGIDYLEVTNIKVEDQPVDSALEYEGTALRVDLQEPLAPGSATSISMDFSENVPSVMGGNYGIYVYLDDILALDSFFPIIPVYNDEGWNVEDPPRNADMIFTDASFFEVRVDAPQDLVLVASGVQVGEKGEGDRRIVTFDAGPERDFYLAASPLFVSDNRTIDGTLVTSYFPPKYENMGEMVLNTAAKALEIYSKNFGEYPYTEMDMVSTPMQAGGMEYSGVAAMALFLYDTAGSTSGTANSVFLESASAHEVAHQWFFDQVMNDQIDQPWLDEGFAQYLTYRYYLDAYGQEAGDSYRQSWQDRWSRVNFEEIPIGLPAADYTPTQYSAIIYGRAPIFIYDLQQMMGTQTFDDFLRQYIATYRWKVVDSQEFKKMAEQICSCNLDSLFAKYGVLQ